MYLLIQRPLDELQREVLEGRARQKLCTYLQALGIYFLPAGNKTPFKKGNHKLTKMFAAAVPSSSRGTGGAPSLPRPRGSNPWIRRGPGSLQSVQAQRHHPAGLPRRQPAGPPSPSGSGWPFVFSAGQPRIPDRESADEIMPTKNAKELFTRKKI
jgi:hypothetical protein